MFFSLPSVELYQIASKDLSSSMSPPSLYICCWLFICVESMICQFGTVFLPFWSLIYELENMQATVFVACIVGMVFVWHRP